MREIRKKLLTGLLVIALMLPMGSMVAMSEEADTAAEDSSSVQADEGQTDQEDQEEGNEDIAPPITEEEALAKTKLVAENSKLALYLNEEEMHFALKVKENGFVWWSEPFNADSDPLANKTLLSDMKSNIYVNYGDRARRNTNKLGAYKDSVEDGNASVQINSDGFTVTYKFRAGGISVPIKYTLGDDCLAVEVLVDQIVETNKEGDSGQVLVDISLLPNMGAAGKDETGYFVVPDGSGAVINFNNGKQGYREYTGDVYGIDQTIMPVSKPSKTEDVYLPMYGIVKEGNALLAVADQGDTQATIKAYVSEQRKTSYNSAYFEFTLRATDYYYIASRPDPLMMFESGDIQTGNIVVNYYPIVDEDASYGTIAKRYREYLTQEKGVTAKTQANSTPLFVELYGGMVKQQSVFGLPLDLKTRVTTYDEAQTILSTLSEAGISDMVITYNNWNDSGIERKVSDKYDPAGILGGKSGWNDFLDYVSGQGYTLYPSMEIASFLKSGNGYSNWFDTTMRVTKAYSKQNLFDLAFPVPAMLRDKWSLLSPYFFPEVFESIQQSFAKNSMSNIAFGELSTTLYSDFGKKRISMVEARDAVVEGYQLMNENGISVLASGANAYLLPYVDYITNVPLSSSGYDVFDYDIPFLQMVLHGLIPYGSTAVNANADSQQLFLKAVAAGSALRYDMIYADVKDLQDSNYDTLFYAKYNGWVDTAAQEYALISQLIAPDSDQLIIKHTYLSPTKTETVYENGSTVTVDWSTGIINYNGTEYNFNEAGYEQAEGGAENE